VRFMLDAAEAKREKETVAEYYKVEYEEYEIEVEEPIPVERKEPVARTYPRHDRNDRPYYHNKRARR